MITKNDMNRMDDKALGQAVLGEMQKIVDAKLEAAKADFLEAGCCDVTPMLCYLNMLGAYRALSSIDDLERSELEWLARHCEEAILARYTMPEIDMDKEQNLWYRQIYAGIEQEAAQ